MGRKRSPQAGTGIGKFLLRGDGDEKAKPDKKFPVAIFIQDLLHHWGKS
jgi:hypothetical protein